MKQCVEVALGFTALLLICGMVICNKYRENYTSRVVHPVGNSALYKVDVANIFKPGDTIWYKSGNEEYKIVIVR